MNKKVTVVGSFIVDLMARTPHLPKAGETVKGIAFKMGPGGKGSNQAIAAKRANCDVTFVSKVGSDEFGDMALNTFKNEGLDTTYIFKDENLETGTALIMVDDSTSQNEIVVTSGACDNITKENLDLCKQVIMDSDILLSQLEINIDAIESTIRLAHENKATIVLNPAPVQEISDEVLSLVDIITPNEVEASIITGYEVVTVEDAKVAATKLQEKGIKDVVITLGKQGVYVKSGDEDKFIEAYKVNAVDTTGAGDAFNGGFVTALSEGKDIFEACKFGNALAALSVTKIGTAPSMPTREEIEELMNKELQLN